MRIKKDDPRRKQVEKELLEEYKSYRDAVLENYLQDGIAIKNEVGDIFLKVGDGRHVSIKELDNTEVKSPADTNFDEERKCLEAATLDLEAAFYYIDLALKSLDIKPYDSIHKRMAYQRISDWKDGVGAYLKCLKGQDDNS